MSAKNSQSNTSNASTTTTTQIPIYNRETSEIVDGIVGKLTREADSIFNNSIDLIKQLCSQNVATVMVLPPQYYPNELRKRLVSESKRIVMENYTTLALDITKQCIITGEIDNEIIKKRLKLKFISQENYKQMKEDIQSYIIRVEVKNLSEFWKSHMMIAKKEEIAAKTNSTTSAAEEIARSMREQVMKSISLNEKIAEEESEDSQEENSANKNEDQQVASNASSSGNHEASNSSQKKKKKKRKNKCKR